MGDQHDISVLNGLTAIALDSMRGYEEAAEDARSTQFAGLFSDFARDRGQVVTSLQSLVRDLGGAPEQNATLMGAAHRGFLDLKQRIVGTSDKAIIAEIEREEGYIRGKFEAASNDSRLQPPALSTIREAFARIELAHDQARTLKHNLV